MRRKIILAVGSSFSELVRSRKDFLLLFSKIEERISYELSDHIIIYSEDIARQFNLRKYKAKISVARRHFLNFDKFKMQKKLHERDNLIGYIGRLSEEKGILNFVKAIPMIFKMGGDIDFMIGGDGQLRGKVEEYLERPDLSNKVDFIGWIPHDRLPQYLNELKLLVIPSYTETGPLIMVEAMACGTPVLITPVGSVCSVIRDGETGFILGDNSPACIAEKIMRALEHPGLEWIAENARVVVEEEFTYEAIVERYRTILEELFGG